MICLRANASLCWTKASPFRCAQTHPTRKRIGRLILNQRLFYVVFVKAAFFQRRTNDAFTSGYRYSPVMFFLGEQLPPADWIGMSSGPAMGMSLGAGHVRRSAASLSTQQRRGTDQEFSHEG